VQARTRSSMAEGMALDASVAASATPLHMT
jgi:hypothetical protein